MPNEKLRDLFRRLRRDDEIEVAHNFFPAPVTSGDAHARRIGMLPQIILQLLGLGRDRAELETADVFRTIRDR